MPQAYVSNSDVSTPSCCMDQRACALVHIHSNNSLHSLANLHTWVFPPWAECTSIGILDFQSRNGNAWGHAHRCLHVRVCPRMCAHASKSVCTGVWINIRASVWTSEHLRWHERRSMRMYPDMRRSTRSSLHSRQYACMHVDMCERASKCA